MADLSPFCDTLLSELCLLFVHLTSSYFAARDLDWNSECADGIKRIQDLIKLIKQLILIFLSLLLLLLLLLPLVLVFHRPLSYWRSAFYHQIKSWNVKDKVCTSSISLSDSHLPHGLSVCLAEVESTYLSFVCLQNYFLQLYLSRV